MTLQELKSSVVVAREKDLEGGATIGVTVAEESLAKQQLLKYKFDRRVLPIVCALYVFSYLDRGNIGNAKVAGTEQDLKLDDAQWAWVLNSFYIGYEVFEWTTMFWKILPAHILVSFLCLGWGVAAICQGVVTNLAGLISCRVFLAIFECMLATGSPFYLSMFYQRTELGIRMALLLGSSPLASCFASALAFGIVQIGAWAPWRWLFVIEGAPTLLMIPIVYFLLPDSPAQAKFLTTDEQTLAVERLQIRDTTGKSTVAWKQYFAGLRDWKTFVHALIQFAVNYSFSSLNNFLPTIVKDLGYTSINAQGMSAPPYAAAFIGCIVAAIISDRWKKRGPIMAIYGAIGLLGFLLLLLVDVTASAGARYAGIIFACMGTFPVVALNLTWILNNLGSDSKKGASLAIVATVGQLTSFIGSSVFPSTAAPKYTVGCALGCVFTGLITICALFLHFMLEKENKRRGAIYGEVDEDEIIDVSALGDGHPRFRYLT